MAAIARPVGVAVSTPSRKTQRDSPFAEIGDGAGDLGDGSAEPVDRGNDHGVSGPGIVEQRDQSRPGRLG